MDENTQAKFEARLKDLIAAAKKKKNVLEYQEINDFFKDMPLEEDQFDKILETLEQNNIDVLRITDDDDDIPDEELLLSLSADHKLLVTLEENVITGGFGQQVTQFLTDTGQTIKVLQIAIPDQFVEQGSVGRLREETGLDTDSIVKRIIVEYIGM